MLEWCEDTGDLHFVIIVIRIRLVGVMMVGCMRLLYTICIVITSSSSRKRTRSENTPTRGARWRVLTHRSWGAERGTYFTQRGEFLIPKESKVKGKRGKKERKKRREKRGEEKDYNSSIYILYPFRRDTI
jgi:hypothetical protein